MPESGIFRWVEHLQTTVGLPIQWEEVGWPPSAGVSDGAGAEGSLSIELLPRFGGL